MLTPGKKQAAAVIDKVTDVARGIGALTAFTLAIAVSALVIAVAALVIARGARKAAA